MGRLTIDEVIKHCDEAVEQSDRVFRILHDGGDFGQIESKNYWEHKQTAEWLRELKRYKDLEESGRLVVLPCDVKSDCTKTGRHIDIEAVLDQIK